MRLATHAHEITKASLASTAMGRAAQQQRYLREAKIVRKSQAGSASQLVHPKDS